MARRRVERSEAEQSRAEQMERSGETTVRKGREGTSNSRGLRKAHRKESLALSGYTPTLLSFRLFLLHPFFLSYPVDLSLRRLDRFTLFPSPHPFTTDHFAR